MQQFASLFYETKEQEQALVSFVLARASGMVRKEVFRGVTQVTCPISGDDYILLHNMLLGGVIVRYSVRVEAGEA